MASLAPLLSSQFRLRPPFRGSGDDCPNPQTKTMTTNSASDLSVRQLKQVISIKERIEVLERQLNGVLRSPGKASGPRAAARRRTMSAAGRARIAAAQKARWARVKRNSSFAGRATAKGKRKVSASVRARLSAIARKRWAAIRRAGKKRL